MLVVPLSGGVLPWSQICRTLETSSSFTSASEVKFSPLFVCLSVFSRTTQKLLNGFPPSLDGSITGNKVCNLKGDSVAWSQQFRPLDKRKKFWKWEEVWGEGKPLYSSRSLWGPCWIRVGSATAGELLAFTLGCVLAWRTHGRERYLFSYVKEAQYLWISTKRGDCWASLVFLQLLFETTVLPFCKQTSIDIIEIEVKIPPLVIRCTTFHLLS